jgi:hypothetical protein
MKSSGELYESEKNDLWKLGLLGLSSTHANAGKVPKNWQQLLARRLHALFTYVLQLDFILYDLCT